MKSPTPYLGSKTDNDEGIRIYGLDDFLEMHYLHVTDGRKQYIGANARVHPSALKRRHPTS